MRLAGQEKMGFYPTPPTVTAMIRARLDVNQASHFAALDPCAGGGIALAELTAGTSATTYGIEPDRERYTQAAGRLDHALLSALEETTISHQSFSLALVNPPYDAEHVTAAEAEATGKKTQRKERIFLGKALSFLAPRGVLILIVPAHILDADTRAYLASRLDDLECWHFPEPEREQFKQAVAIGRKADGKKANPIPEITEAPPTTAPHIVPVSNPELKIWRTSRIEPEALARAAEASPLWAQLAPTTAEARAERRPGLPLHSGHLTLLLAAGCLDGLIGEGEDRHLVRGKTAKLQKQHSSESHNEETGSTTTTTTRRDKYVVALKILRPTGEIQELR